MSKAWTVIGIVVLLLIGFMWYRGSKMTQTYSVDMSKYPSKTDVSNSSVSENSTIDQDLQAVDNQINQITSDSASLDSSLKSDY